MYRSFALVAISLTILLACSPVKDKQAAESAVKKFPTQLDAEQYHDIYAASTQDFQRASTESDMTDLFKAIHRKLGLVRNAQQSGFHINYTTNGEIITLNYSTQFATAAADEQFAYRMDHGQPLLTGYHINSKQLITR